MRYLSLFSLLLFGSYPLLSYADTAQVYQKNCASCHGEHRLGGTGAALLPENLSRLRPKKAFKVIKNGRAATQMPAFSKTLDDKTIQSLVDYIYTPLAKIPTWGVKEMLATQVIHHDETKLPTKAKYTADPLNLFLVVELGDHHVTVLDGDKFEPIHRFPSRYALHGGPKYTRDGRFVYFASRDGWVSKFDMVNLTYIAEIRAGINTRNIAVSPDGRYVMVANYLPNSLVLLDGKDLTPIKVIPVKDKTGKSSRVSAVYTAYPRHSFIAALKDIPEVWEINYEDNPPPDFGQWVHDYRPDSGEVSEVTRFPIRRLFVEDYLDDFFFDPEYIFLIGASRDGKAQVLDLDTGRVNTTLQLAGMPHLGSGITWEYQGKQVMATPHLKQGVVSIIDTSTWKTIKKLDTLGPGFFMRSHENSPYAWVDVFFGKNKDAVHIIDKKTLEIVKTLRPVAGKTAAHVEFDREGKHALLSIWDNDGALIIYDAITLEEVKRLPMRKPSGKYNVYNKTRLSTGTSH